MALVAISVLLSKLFEDTPLRTIIFFGGPVVSWPLASIPIWIQRRRDANKSEPFVIPYPR